VANKIALWIKVIATAGLIVVLFIASLLSGQVLPQTVEPAVYVAPGVVIDAGHGGYDGGAEWGGVIEKDINLAISMQLREILLAAGYRVGLKRFLIRKKGKTWPGAWR